MDTFICPFVHCAFLLAMGTRMDKCSSGGIIWPRPVFNCLVYYLNWFALYLIIYGCINNKKVITKLSDSYSTPTLYKLFTYMHTYLLTYLFTTVLVVHVLLSTCRYCLISTFIIQQNRHLHEQHRLILFPASRLLILRLSYKCNARSFARPWQVDDSSRW